MINQQWIEELKTTDKKQRTALYYDRMPDGEESFCALGVGLALYFEQECGLALEPELFFDDELILSAREWLGLTSTEVEHVGALIVNWNDINLFSFREIAERLEQINERE